MAFELEKFVDAPTQEELKVLKKDDLLSIAKHYKLEDIKKSMRKAAICNSLLRYFVGQEIFEESELEFLEETEVGSKASEQLAMRKLEIKERQREKDREIEEKQKDKKMEFELELKKMEMEEKQKDREIEERQRNMELEVEERGNLRNEREVES